MRGSRPHASRNVRAARSGRARPSAETSRTTRRSARARDRPRRGTTGETRWRAIDRRRSRIIAGEVVGRAPASTPLGDRRRFGQRIGPRQQPVRVVDARPICSARAAASRTSSAPSSSSSETSWPAAALICRSRRQVWKRSTQATTRYSCHPTPSTANRAAHSSVPGATSVIGVSRHCPRRTAEVAEVAESGSARSATSAHSAVSRDRSRSTADDDVVAVREDVGGDIDRFAGGALDREAAAVDRGATRLDDDPRERCESQSRVDVRRRSRRRRLRTVDCDATVD